MRHSAESLKELCQVSFGYIVHWSVYLFIRDISVGCDQLPSSGRRRDSQEQ
jgi:hypothetical protein